MTLQGKSQSYTTTTALPVDLDLGTNYASCASPGTKKFDFTIPAGLPNMDLTTFGLKLIKLSFADCNSSGNYSMQFSAYLKSPSGKCVKVFDGATPGLTTLSGFGTTQVGMVSSNLGSCLEPITTGNLNYSLSSANHTLDATGIGGYYSTSVLNPSTGVLTPINYIDSFKNTNPVGTWSLYFFESTGNAPCLTGAQLDFGTISPPADNTLLGDDCVNAIQYNGLSMCVQTNGKDSSYNMPGWNGGALNGIGAFSGCDWNGANNNDVWIKITPQTAGNTCINVSGLKLSSQSIVVTDPNLDGDNKPCTSSSPGGNYWNVVSCPQNLDGSTNDPIYGTSAGSIRPHNHCWNANANQTYYLVVDGNGGTESPFYVYGGCNLPNLLITDPAPVCPPATVSINTPAITNGSYLFGGTLSYFQDAAGTIPLTNPGAIAAPGGTYYVKASTNPNCPSVIKPVNVTFTPPPSVTLTGSAVCPPNTSSTLTSNTSVVGVNYQLYDSNNNPVGSPLPGTGSALTWTNVPVGSGYYVKGTTSAGCESLPSNNAAVSQNPKPISLNLQGQ